MAEKVKVALLVMFCRKVPLSTVVSPTSMMKVVRFQVNTVVMDFKEVVAIVGQRFPNGKNSDCGVGFYICRGCGKSSMCSIW